MKVFLTNKDIVVEGYKTIHVSNIDELSDGEVYQLYLDELLINSFPLYDLVDKFNSWIKKVELGGTVIIQGVDIQLFARDIVYNLVENDTIQGILENMRCALTWKDMKEILVERDFDILRVELNGSGFILEARRVN